MHVKLRNYILQRLDAHVITRRSWIADGTTYEWEGAKKNVKKSKVSRTNGFLRLIKEIDGTTIKSLIAKEIESKV